MNDLLVELLLHLDFRDVCSLACSCKEFKDLIVSPKIRNHISLCYNFPFDMMLYEMVDYNKMSPKVKLYNAIKTDDKRLLQSLKEQDIL